jgi:hypothetical protein
LFSWNFFLVEIFVGYGLKPASLILPGSGRAVTEFFHARAAQLGETPRAVKVTDDEQNDGGGPACQRIDQSQFADILILINVHLPEEA